LGGTIERDRVNLVEFEGSDHCQYRVPPQRQFRVRELRPETQAVQRSKALGCDQRA